MKVFVQIIACLFSVQYSLVSTSVLSCPLVSFSVLSMSFTSSVLLVSFGVLYCQHGLLQCQTNVFQSQKSVLERPLASSVLQLHCSVLQCLLNIFQCPFSGWLPAGCIREKSVATLIWSTKIEITDIFHHGSRHPTQSLKTYFNKLSC